MNVDVDVMAVTSPLPRDVKGKNACIIFLTMADGERVKANLFSSVGTCPHSEWSEVISFHLPSTRAVRGVALNGWPNFIMPQSNPPNLLYNYTS